MRVRWYVVFLLLITSFRLSASTSEWLSQMIAQKSQATKLNSNSSQKSQENGFFKAHGFIFFYASQCPHCHHFAPILKTWVQKHKAEILPLSFDNQPLSEFPHFLPATTDWVNVAYQGTPIHYPALFVVNLKTKKLYPASIGSMTYEELSMRMKGLIPKIESYEHQEKSV
ncbi:TPA: type-F conjugative transfer system pilin assembly thiol-disulfide isomerase TrbB [Legionella anisa]